MSNDIHRAVVAADQDAQTACQQIAMDYGGLCRKHNRNTHRDHLSTNTSCNTFV